MLLTAHIPIALAEQVDFFAARLERPKGWIVRQAIASWVDLEAKRYQLTLDGLTNVDTNQVVDHSLVATWAESLGQAE